MKIYELTPQDGRKSFYGKAKVKQLDDGTEILQSYETDVMKRTPDGRLYRLYTNWTATTGRHIIAFCGLNKAAWQKIPTEVTT